MSPIQIPTLLACLARLDWLYLAARGRDRARALRAPGVGVGNVAVGD